ncbi:unnamed protein product, partial [Brassica rapa subsp. narinosa]
PNPKFREPFAFLLLLLRFCFTNLLINQYTFQFFSPLISFMASFHLPPLRLFITLFFFTDLLHTKIYSQAINFISKSPVSGDLTSKTDDFFPGSFLEVSDVGSMAIIEHQRSEDYDPAICTFTWNFFISYSCCLTTFVSLYSLT